MNKVYNSYPASCVRICMDHAKDECIRGRIYCPQLRMPVPFVDLGDLFLKLDFIFDQRGYPMPYYQHRTFRPRSIEKSISLLTQPEEIERNIQSISSCRGKCATLLLYVTTRLGGTWGGHAEWADTAELALFESELELTRLILKRLEIASAAS